VRHFFQSGALRIRVKGDKKMKAAAIALMLALIATDASAQQRTIYGADGRVTARAATDSQGTTTYYGPDGRVIAKETCPALSCNRTRKMK
jgi:hypothetical protein